MAKILSKQEFLAIDKPVLYRRWDSDNKQTYDGFEIKHSTYEHLGKNIDFTYIDLATEWIEINGEVKLVKSWVDIRPMFERVIASKEDFEFEYHIARDGGYDPDELFVVYDDNDVKQLIERLQGLLTKNAKKS